MVIIALEGSMAILINGDWNPISGHDLPQQPEIAFGAFEEKKARRQDGPRRIINSRHQTTRRMIGPEPLVRAAIPKDHPALLGLALPTLPMTCGPALSFG
jgi:hypothetical protein